MKRNTGAAVQPRVTRLDVEQLRLITKVARMHYIHGDRQATIAEKLDISQASVSRFLSLAEEQGIVRTVVVPPEGLHPDLEERIVQATELDAVYVVDVPGHRSGIASALGTAAARCLAEEFHDAKIVGFTSWSTTLREMAHQLETRGKSATTHVVETLGDLGSPLLQHEAALATSQVAKALHAEAVFLRTPGVAVSEALRAAALADTHNNKAMRLLDKLDLAFVGIGPADFHGPLEEGDNFFTAEQLAAVRDAGAVGQLHQRFIDASGKAVQTHLDDLVMGITLDQLRQARRRIAVAGGVDKHQAIAAALNGRWIDVLVTDVNTAQFLLSQNLKGNP
jgi:DNA-binding transcriptional regulator LsrR (DeoR family)